MPSKSSRNLLVKNHTKRLIDFISFGVIVHYIGTSIPPAVHLTDDSVSFLKLNVSHNFPIRENRPRSVRSPNNSALIISGLLLGENSPPRGRLRGAGGKGGISRSEMQAQRCRNAARASEYFYRGRFPRVAVSIPRGGRPCPTLPCVFAQRAGRRDRGEGRVGERGVRIRLP